MQIRVSWGGVDEKNLNVMNTDWDDQNTLKTESESRWNSKHRAKLKRSCYRGNEWHAIMCRNKNIGENRQDLVWLNYVWIGENTGTNCHVTDESEHMWYVIGILIYRTGEMNLTSGIKWNRNYTGKLRNLDIGNLSIGDRNGGRKRREMASQRKGKLRNLITWYTDRNLTTEANGEGSGHIDN